MSGSEAPALSGRRSWTATPFLVAVLVAPLVYQVSMLLFASSTSPGIPVPVLLLLAVLVLMIVAWVKGPATAGPWGALATVFFGLGLALWAYTAIGGAMKGATLVGATIVVPVALLLLLLRRPDDAAIWRAADIFAWAFAGACVLVLALEVAGLVPSWYVLYEVDQMDLASYDRSYYWLPFTDALGLDGRWGGPLRHPNPSGGVAALLLVYAFLRPRGRRLAFAATGVLVLLLTCSRSAYAAAALGLVVLVVLPGWNVRPWWRPTPSRVIAALLGVALGLRVVLWVEADTGLSGRSEMWGEFISLWPQSPVFGVGEAVIVRAVEDGVLPPWAFHGHNLYLDTLVRYGIVGVVLAAALLAVVALLAIGRARAGQGGPLAMLLALGITTVAEIVFDWRYPMVPSSVLLVILLLSVARSDGAVPVAEGSGADPVDEGAPVP